MKHLIIIIYEIYNREFIGKLLLALKLNTKNFPVLLIPNNSYGDCHYVLRTIHNIIPKNSIIIDKSMDSVTYKFLQKDSILDKFKYTSCDAEGFCFSYENEERELRSYLPFAEKITKVFTWGNKDYNFLKEKFKKNNINENNVVKTGNICYDICKKKYRDIFKKELTNEVNLIKNEKYILFIGWSYGYYLNDSAPGTSYFCNKYGIPVKDFNEYISGIKKLHNLWISLMLEVCNKYKDYIVVFKPHPPVALEGDINRIPGLKKLTENSNFKIWNSETIIEPLLLFSKCVIHCGSSCGLQCNLLGVENISFSPNLNKLLHYPFTTKGNITSNTAIICDSINGSILKLDNILNNNYRLNIPEETKNLIKNEYLNNYEENTFAYDSIIKELIDLSNNSHDNIENRLTDENIPIFINKIKKLAKVKWTWKTRHFNKKSVENLISSFLDIDKELKINDYELFDNFNAVFIY
jgi:surface carbohydrate biosynthesis protein